jgi:hypothetical protein
MRQNRKKTYSKQHNICYTSDNGHFCPFLVFENVIAGNAFVNCRWPKLRREGLGPARTSDKGQANSIDKSFSKFVKNGQKRPITLTGTDSYIFHTPLKNA